MSESTNMSDQAVCAHLSVSHMVQAVHPHDPTQGIRGWRECDSECDTRFGPITSSFISMIHATCQYSKLIEFERIEDQNQASLLFSQIFHAITDTAKEWHTKPGAVYLNHDDHKLVASSYINGIPVGIAKVPEDYFMLTDGQELMD